MFNIHSLIENQFKSYLERGKLIIQPDSVFAPCITFSQETGSGGRKIAESVAKQLGFKFYNKELIEMIAKKSKLKKELIDSIDEKTQNTIESIVNSFLGVEAASEHTYIKSLIWVMLSVARRGSAVFLGRGGNFIIPPDQALRVRIIAPIKVRISNSAKYEHPHLSLARIRDKIMKVHLERKDFVKKYFNKDISNANYYDLVVNTQFLTLSQSTEIIINAFQKRFSR